MMFVSIPNANTDMKLFMNSYAMKATSIHSTVFFCTNAYIQYIQYASHDGGTQTPTSFNNNTIVQ